MWWIGNKDINWQAKTVWMWQGRREGEREERREEERVHNTDQRVYRFHSVYMLSF